MSFWVNVIVLILAGLFTSTYILNFLYPPQSAVLPEITFTGGAGISSSALQKELSKIDRDFYVTKNALLLGGYPPARYLDLNYHYGTFTTDINSNNAIQAVAFFGSGAGLTDVMTQIDANKYYVPYVGSDYDVNLNYHDLNTRSVSAVAFFGSGAGLTNVLSATDYDDINKHFVPYVGADFDTNLNYHDLNAKSISAVAFFGSGAALTGVISTTDYADINAHLVPYIGADYDTNLGIYGIKSFSSDVNFNTIQAKYYYGSGIYLTSIPSLADIDANFVPYSGSNKDVDLGGYDLSATNLIANNVDTVNLEVQDLFSGDDADLNTLTIKNTIDVANGTGATPSIAFTNNTGTGIFSVGGQSVEFSVDSSTFLSIYANNQPLQEEVFINGALVVNEEIYAQEDFNVARDSNLFRVAAYKYFGDGSRLTGIPKDINNHFVPYIGGTKDVNLNGYDFNAFIIQGDRFKTADANSVYGAHSVAFGLGTTAFGDQSAVIGTYSTAAGEGSVAIGSNIEVEGFNSVGIGSNANTTNNNAISIGTNTLSKGLGSITIGYAPEPEYAITSAGSGSIAGGYSSDPNQVSAGGIGAIALGYNTKVFGDGSVSLGYDTNTNANYASAIGYKIFNLNPYSVAIGPDVNIAQDLNVMRDLNVVRDSNLFSVTAGFFFGSGAALTGIPTQTDVNANFVGFVRVGSEKDLNLALGGVTGWDGNFYTVESNYFFGDGSGLTGVTGTTNWVDINAHVYGKLDVNTHFVPYIGATRDVNLSERKLVAGDSNFGNQQFWEFTSRDIGGGVMYPALIPWSDVGNYGLMEGGLTITTPSGAGDVVMGLYSTDTTKSWYFTRTDADGRFSLSKLVDTAPFFINSATAIIGDFNVSNDMNIGDDLNVIGDVNVRGSVQATAFFGNGAGLTGVTGTTNWVDINAHVYGKLDTNTMFEDVFDLNTFYYKKTDVNAHFYGIVDLNRQFYGKIDTNAGWYGKLDVNAHFVPFVSTSASINIRSDLNISKSINKGVSISSDTNRICFPSNSCEMFLDFNGTAFVFGS